MILYYISLLFIGPSNICVGAMWRLLWFVCHPDWFAVHVRGIWISKSRTGIHFSFDICYLVLQKPFVL